MHSIHDLIINSGDVYDMTALNIFDLIYGLMIIDDNNLCDKFEIKLPRYKQLITNM